MNDEYANGHPVTQEELLRLSGIARDVQGSIGIRALCRQFETDAGKALAELVAIDPHKTDEIARLQNDVRRFIDIREHIAQIMSHGEAAERTLTGDAPD